MDLAKKYASKINELRHQLQAAREENMELEMAKEVAVAAAQASQGGLSGVQANQQAAASWEATSLQAELETKRQRIDELNNAVASKASELETKRRDLNVLRVSEQQAQSRATKLDQELKFAKEQAQSTQFAKKEIKEEDNNSARSIELLRTQLAEADLEMEKLRTDLEASTSELNALRSSPAHQAEMEAELREAHGKYQDKVILLGIRDEKIKKLTDKLKICESEKVSFENRLNCSIAETGKFKKELKEMKKAGEQRYVAPFSGSQPSIMESYSQTKKRPSPYSGMQGYDPKRSKSFSTQASEHEDDEEPNGEEHKLVVGRGREGDNINVRAPPWWPKKS